MIMPNTITTPGRPKPNELAQALTGRPYISHSEITAFQACPLKHYFAYVEHAEPEILSAAMLVGTCTHAAIQRHLEARMASDSLPTVDELMDTYRQTWKLDAEKVPEIQFARDDTAETLEGTARQMLETFLASPFAQPTGNLIGIEETLHVKLADDLPDLCGRVDVIEHRPDVGELVITDYKTTRSMWSPDTADEHSQQLLLYAHAVAPLARDLDAKVRLQFIIITKGKTPKIDALPVEINPDRVERTRTVVRRVFMAMQAGVVYPAPSAMNCNGCAFRQRCEKWHRTAEMF
jgi:CRISPR/Cas system-associated exonuclease Cas4 (RecB family)